MIKSKSENLKSEHREGSMHFLFVATFLGQIGGIETLIARMSTWLVRKGHRVTLLANSVHESRALFHEEMKFVELGDRISQVNFFYKAKSTWADLGIERPDVIKAFSLSASWIACILASIIQPTPKVLFGNYFPCMIPQRRNPFKSTFLRLFLFNLRWSLSDDSILCMSEEQISEFQRHYGQDRNPIFWPLPVEDPSKNGGPRTPRWGSIVSIGRLAPMKEYNLYMIDVIARLRQKGYPVTWTVFGDGELVADMRTRISTLGLGEAIALKGNLAYTQFAAAMQNAYLFVGMGTSIIEAALCGVPGVVALAHDRSGVSYGSLYTLRFGSCGEKTNAAPTTTVEAEIERLLKLQWHEYESEIKKTREYASSYTMDHSMDRFLEIVANASAPKTAYVLFHWYYLHCLVRKLLQKPEVTD